jgi:transposase
LDASESTVRRDLRALGFRARKRPWAPYRYEGDAAARSNFTRVMREFRGKVVFSDEKLFDVCDHGAQWEWVPKGQRPQTRGITRYVPRIHVWAMIGIGIKCLVFLPEGNLTAELYIRHVLSRHVAPLLQNTDVIFMQDGAPAHRASRTMDYLARKNVRVIDNWPPRSPDLNPVENLWAILQRKVSDRGPQTKEHLKQFVQEAWDALEQEFVDSFVRSFQSRCEAIFLRQGE